MRSALLLERRSNGGQAVIRSATLGLNKTESELRGALLPDNCAIQAMPKT